MSKENIDEAAKRRGRGGRPTDPTMQKVVLDCIERGLGYSASIPTLIEHGYKRNNKCSITKRQFDYVQLKYSSQRIIRIKADAEVCDWAKNHEDEILELIKARMSEDLSRTTPASAEDK